MSTAPPFNSPTPLSALDPAAGAAPAPLASISPDALRQHLRNANRRAGQLKGRQPDDTAVAELRRLIGAGPHRRDQLIELLHLLNDRHGALFQRHLVALAAELRLGLAEVAEVASFYHHFETVPDGTIPPALTLRVCDGLSCTMAGAASLQQALTTADWPGVRVVAVPCVGRCEPAPVVLVGQRPVPFATVATLAELQHCVDAGLHQHPLPADDAQFDPVDFVQQAVTVPQADISPAYVGTPPTAPRAVTSWRRRWSTASAMLKTCWT